MVLSDSNTSTKSTPNIVKFLKELSILRYIRVSRLRNFSMSIHDLVPPYQERLEDNSYLLLFRNRNKFEISFCSIKEIRFNNKLVKGGYDD